jgi:hypothetical protein
LCPLVNPAALFRFRFTAPRRNTLWPPSASGLDEACRLPSLAAVNGVPDLLAIWAAWNDEGLALRGSLSGVGSGRWCHPAKPEDSDGLHVWIATRSTGASHRAGRFCRRIAILPTGGGRRADRPIAVAAAIPRAIEPAPEMPEHAVRVESSLLPDGWRVDALLTPEALPGWDPGETSRLGFFVAAVDRRLGRLPVAAPPEYPWEGDPTTWSELELSR